jgi:hypothetical protein
MLIDGTDVGTLIHEFKGRRISLFHACQWVDFRSYLKAGGVPSRDVLEKSGSYTRFDSDQQDKDNGVWEKVFFNLKDFGQTFATGRIGGDEKRPTSATPNAFGPILLVFSPEVLRQASDVAVCLRSAGYKDFDRVSEGVGIAKIPDLFQEAIGETKAKWLKDSATLKAELGLKYDARQPELSCTFPTGVAGLAHAAAVIVDPVGRQGVPLRELVEKELSTVSGLVPKERTGIYPARQPVYSEMAKLIGGLTAPELAELKLYSDQYLAKLSTDTGVSAELKIWATACRGSKLSWMFGRYATYLYEGTLAP